MTSIGPPNHVLANQVIPKAGSPHPTAIDPLRNTRVTTHVTMKKSSNKPDAMSEKQKPSETSPQGASFNQSPSFTARLASMFQVSEQRLNESAHDLSAAFRKYKFAQLQKTAKTNRSSVPVAQDEVVGSDICADVHSKERTSLGLANNMNLTTPSTSSTLPRFGGPQPPASPPLTLDYNEDDAMCSAGVGKEDVVETADEASYLKTHLDLPSRGPSRSSKDETASTTSTTASRNKTTCKSCGAPGSQVTPLVPCNRSKLWTNSSADDAYKKNGKRRAGTILKETA
ncbi:hypothetical protein LTR10_013427 [Elasticomyces elasticus]|uniref:GATA-type domain-containing protein n=1 Tax=Exophiala sideris TaxID=1016849 RepID=A0ABR0J4H5_9EURO|nr:hypothetical protein LTR10_013427 [Elasticomyces elasticus]KAK5027343.1 hypothetical protein LTS07_006945 [Exophiala sideris]KAK5034955.1 hypothetical protein LTR13_006137 [Exophiala sideris]KAK5056311.1 hypothetical protein LTR69_007852 [Exophiala sideris]KAK5181200.1 hypothetical protein LTR44_006531 [Eurotiomycetes sp. CCFEE 6388]